MSGGRYNRGWSFTLKKKEEVLFDKNTVITLEPVNEKPEQIESSRRLGLGIDAGGTYTDAVIFDFRTREVLAKSKALTTKWKYSLGIMEAVNALPGKYRDSIDQISVSTTLVTNAIVESNQRPVGLLLMPNGRDVPGDLKYQPLKVIQGRMTIGGEITEDINPEEIRREVRHMISQFHVEAFAVSGYGGSVNPALELEVKKIIRDETGLEVCCGHELSGILNFSIRAVTAVLNAGVMPIMEDFLKEMELSIVSAGIKAPLLVVRGDGAVMNETFAREFPVQTALSGPAASMAGAMFLTGNEDALVIDVGGTTSDIGFIENNRVTVCEKGARIGDWDTHIKAVDMLTSGLGGDSEVIFHRQNWILGPRRITPISWLGTLMKLEEVTGTDRKWAESTIPLQYLYRTGKMPDFELTSREKAVFEVLEEKPLMIGEIMDRLGIGTWKLVKSARLENSYCVQRAGLTPTDVFHQEGKLSLWNKDIASRYMDLIADSAEIDSADLALRIRRMIIDKLGSVLIEKMMGLEIAEGSGISQILNHGNNYLSLKPEITIPVVGLGAPAALMLKDTVRQLNGRLTLCKDGDVANALGAITSNVRVSVSARIAVSYSGEYRIYGLEGEEESFEFLSDAEKRCIEVLGEQTRIMAAKAGTSAQKVTITIKSAVATSTEGTEVFVERTYLAEISGIPDLV